MNQAFFFPLLSKSQEPRLKVPQKSTFYNNCKYLCPLRVSNFAMYQNTNTALILQSLVKSNSPHPGLSPQHNHMPRAPYQSSFQTPSGFGSTTEKFHQRHQNSTYSYTAQLPYPHHMTLNQASLLSRFCGSTVPSTHISLGLTFSSNMSIAFMFHSWPQILNGLLMLWSNPTPFTAPFLFSKAIWLPSLLDSHITFPTATQGSHNALRKVKLLNLLNYLLFIKQFYWQQEKGHLKMKLFILLR